MDLETFLREHADVLGNVWFPPSSLRAMIAQDRVRVAGTDNAIVWEFVWQNGQGAQFCECWTSADGFAADCFRHLPGGTGGLHIV
jgi:hypothetical protein